MKAKVVALPVKFNPKRTYPKKKIPKNVVRFPEVMTLTRRIRLHAAQKEAR